jgi:hypothetical protein
VGVSGGGRSRADDTDARRSPRRWPQHHRPRGVRPVNSARRGHWPLLVAGPLAGVAGRLPVSCPGWSVDERILRHASATVSRRARAPREVASAGEPPQPLRLRRRARTRRRVRRSHRVGLSHHWRSLGRLPGPGSAAETARAK